jgi:hypothetical protein
MDCQNFTLTLPTSRSSLDFCVELTHGLAYLVFKYQPLLKHRFISKRNYRLYRSIFGCQAAQAGKLIICENQQNLLPEDKYVFSTLDRLLSSGIHKSYQFIKSFRETRPSTFDRSKNSVSTIFSRFVRRDHDGLIEMANQIVRLPPFKYSTAAYGASRKDE